MQAAMQQKEEKLLLFDVNLIFLHLNYIGNNVLWHWLPIMAPSNYNLFYVI